MVKIDDISLKNFLDRVPGHPPNIYYLRPWRYIPFLADGHSNRMEK
jgi:hypothetical protein